MFSPLFRLLVLLLVGGLLFGCARTAPIVVDSPEPVSIVVPIVEPPLPGTDSLIVEGVSEAFDSTFVAFDVEQLARENHLRGQELFNRIEGILAEMVGPSSLPDSFPIEEGNVDTVAFELANQEARQALADAARAQLAMDSTTALTLLNEAQELFERAVSLNPWYEEAQYQLAQVYTIRASYFQDVQAWSETLEILRELVKLRADEHGLWAEMAIAFENTGRSVASGLTWRHAAQVVLEDSEYAFELTPPPVDSTTFFTYNVQAYRAFVDGRHGEGVRLSLADLWNYAATEEEEEFVLGEFSWALWDYDNFENRLVFDSLRSAAVNDPLGARAEIGALMPGLSRPSAIREAKYNHAILSYDSGHEDAALDTLNRLWHDTMRALDDSSGASEARAAESFFMQDGSMMAMHNLTRSPLPYPEFMTDLREAYATFLFERALFHRQQGASALAFTYLMQVGEIKSSLAGKAFVEALRLARYNPRQALELEPQVEAIYATMENEDKLAYLTQMGQHHRRLGNNEAAAKFLQRYRDLRSSLSN